MAKKMDLNKIQEEIESFKSEYPEYTDEHVSDYIQLLDDFTKAEKDEFAKRLGY